MQPIEIVFLLEEQSAKFFLEVLLPKLIPSSVRPLYLKHEGKSDLQKSIPIKLKAWRNPNSVFIILHDKDSNDYKKLEKELQELCAPYNQRKHFICIACNELEAWYFGDLDAVEKAYPTFSAEKYRNRSKYRKSDEIKKPSKELEKLIKDFSKTKAAKKIPRYMNIKNNQSPSFQYMLNKVQGIVAT